MKRFLLLLTTVAVLFYTYAFRSLHAGIVTGVFLFVPFLMIWLLPVLYWGKKERKDSRSSHILHYLAYLSMAFISFLLVYLLSADILHTFLNFPYKAEIVLTLAFGSLIAGHLIARNGPGVVPVTVTIADLPKELEGFKIAHITDLHIGLTIRKKYVEEVVEKTLATFPDLIALTGDIADGDINKYGEDSLPLSKLGETGKAWLVPGNHDYYSNWPAWKKKFQSLKLNVLENQFVEKENYLLGGVTDPAAKMYGENYGPEPKRAINPKSERFKILLAHNPKLAVPSAEAGFDLMLSGHTHAGQFFPWTLVVKMVHRPHYGGLSDEGRMKVYVGPGTGTWGPPVRLGTTPEIALITLRGRSS
ncbi:MAG: metallophosphoesterase [Bacteriovoracaceae bacterium]